MANLNNKPGMSVVEASTLAQLAMNVYDLFILPVDAEATRLIEDIAAFLLAIKSGSEIDRAEAFVCASKSVNVLSILTWSLYDQVKFSLKGWMVAKGGGKGKYADVLSSSRLYDQAEVWLGKKADNTNAVEWTREGLLLLKGQAADLEKGVKRQNGLNAPWGHCKCGRKLMPYFHKSKGDVTVVDKKDWTVFETCPECHKKEIYELDEVKPKRQVKKPGSAARRSDGPRSKPTASEGKPKGGKKKGGTKK